MACKKKRKRKVKNKKKRVSGTYGMQNKKNPLCKVVPRYLKSKNQLSLSSIRYVCPIIPVSICSDVIIFLWKVFLQILLQVLFCMWITSRVKLQHSADLSGVEDKSTDS